MSYVKDASEKESEMENLKAKKTAIKWNNLFCPAIVCPLTWPGVQEVSTTVHSLSDLPVCSEHMLGSTLYRRVNIAAKALPSGMRPAALPGMPVLG